MSKLFEYDSSETYFDCTNRTVYKLLKECTVKEFCEDVIKNHKDEYGTIGYVAYDSFNGRHIEPIIEFRCGKYVFDHIDDNSKEVRFNIDNKLANAKVHHIESYGYWYKHHYELNIEIVKEVQL